MSPTFQQISPTEWRWQDGERHWSARLFASTHRIIWSSWLETGAAPAFSEGLSQTFDAFLAHGVPESVLASPALINVLRMAATAAHVKRRRRFCNG